MPNLAGAPSVAHLNSSIRTTMPNADYLRGLVDANELIRRQFLVADLAWRQFVAAENEQHAAHPRSSLNPIAIYRWREFDNLWGPRIGAVSRNLGEAVEAANRQVDAVGTRNFNTDEVAVGREITSAIARNIASGRTIVAGWPAHDASRGDPNLFTPTTQTFRYMFPDAIAVRLFGHGAPAGFQTATRYTESAAEIADAAVEKATEAGEAIHAAGGAIHRFTTERGPGGQLLSWMRWPFGIQDTFTVIGVAAILALGVAVYVKTRPSVAIATRAFKGWDTKRRAARAKKRVKK